MTRLLHVMWPVSYKWFGPSLSSGVAGVSHLSSLPEGVPPLYCLHHTMPPSKVVFAYLLDLWIRDWRRFGEVLGEGRAATISHRVAVSTWAVVAFADMDAVFCDCCLPAI